MKKFAIDNNVLVILVGMDKAYQQLIENKVLPSEIKPEMLLKRGSMKISQYYFLIRLYKYIRQKKIRITILPTVLKESFAVEDYEKVAFRKNGLNIFYRTHCYDFVSFSSTEQHFIEELAKNFVNSTPPAFIENKNPKNSIDDAMIMAEACFANANLITFDKHFSNTNRIQEIARKIVPELKPYCIQNFNPDVEIITLTKQNNFMQELEI